MLKSANSYLNIPIISLYNSTKIGEIQEFVVDSEIGKVIGIIVDKGEIKGTFKVISTVDIREVSNDAVIVDSEEALVLQGDIIRIDKVIKSGIKIIKNKVETESGVYVGKVFDFLLDSFFYVMKLYIKPSLSNIFESQLIIPRELIIKITKEKIIISDDAIKKIKSSEPVIVTQ